MRSLLLVLSLGSLVGCGGDGGDYMIVTIDKRPAVNDAKTIRVKLSNAGSERSDDLDLGSKSFPATFSISFPGRAGDLGIEVSALDANGLLVGRGSTMTTVEAPTASVMIDTADFVVNTEFADDQLLSNYFAANGFQLAATSDGTWTATNSASCQTPCNIFGRRFDQNGRAVSSQAAAGTNQFVVSTKLTSFWSTPTVAANTSTTLFIWNNDQFPPPQVAPAGTPGYSIDCRAFDMTGAPTSTQITVSTDFLALLTSVAPMSNGNFAVVWDGKATDTGLVTIRSAIVKPDCTTLAGSLLPVSTVTGTASVHGSHATASGNNIMYVWVLDGNVHTRLATFMNTFSQNDSQIITASPTEEIEHVRVAPLPGGNFAVFVRWALKSGSSGPGRIEMFRANNTGTVMGPPVVVTTRSGSDFQSKESFGVAAQSDGSIFVVWHSCMTNGDDSGCGVFGRLISAAGMPVGQEIQLNTTTKDDQTGPSVVALPGTPVSFATAWTDKSAQPPDTAGSSVRARVIYPLTDGGM